MQRQYEVIDYAGTNFTFKMGTTAYVPPHIHFEIEVGVIVDGLMRIRYPGIEHIVRPGDLFLANSCQCHECFGAGETSTYTYVELQISPAFFRAYYPLIDSTSFTPLLLNDVAIGVEHRRALAAELLGISELFFRKGERYGLQCAGRIDLLFDHMLACVPHRVLDEQEQKAADQRNARVVRIASFIEANADQKLLLKDVAEREGLTMTYLSHFFHENFGMAFQEYVLRLRCRRALELLATTDMTVTDVAMVSGFSAIRYLREGFTRIYGRTPEAWRAEARGRDKPHAALYTDKESVETLQQIQDALQDEFAR